MAAISPPVDASEFKREKAILKAQKAPKPQMAEEVKTADQDGSKLNKPQKGGN